MASGWLRLIFGIVAGIAVAIGTVLAVEGIGHGLFPTAPGTATRDIVAAMPPAAQATVLIGWFFASLLGGIVAMLIARHRVAPWVVAAVIVTGAIASFAAMPHPWWMIVGGVALPPLAALLVTRRIRAARAPVA